MKKRLQFGKLEKLVILVMVVTLAVSILPQLDVQQLFAGGSGDRDTGAGGREEDTSAERTDERCEGSWKRY